MTVEMVYRPLLYSRSKHSEVKMYMYKTCIIEKPGSWVWTWKIKSSNLFSAMKAHCIALSKYWLHFSHSSSKWQCVACVRTPFSHTEQVGGMEWINLRNCGWWSHTVDQSLPIIHFTGLLQGQGDHTTHCKVLRVSFWMKLIQMCILVHGFCHKGNVFSHCIINTDYQCI